MSGIVIVKFFTDIANRPKYHGSTQLWEVHKVSEYEVRSGVLDAARSKPLWDVVKGVKRREEAVL